MTEKTTRSRACDHCGADLTVTDHPYGWHYTLGGEFTPSTCRVGYDPHPEPPEDMHFCGKECLARWIGNTFGSAISHSMAAAGGDILAATGKIGSVANYSEQAKLDRAVFLAMWEAREKP